MKQVSLTVSRPHPLLRSNGGHNNKYAVSAARKAAKNEARWVTLEAMGGRRFDAPKGAKFDVEYLEILGPRAQALDWDNLIGSMKPYLDGICETLGINDRHVVDFHRAEPKRGERSAVRARLWIRQDETMTV